MVKVAFAQLAVRNKSNYYHYTFPPFSGRIRASWKREGIEGVRRQHREGKRIGLREGGRRWGWEEERKVEE